MVKKNLIVSPYKAKFINNSEVLFLADYSKSQDIENISNSNSLPYHWNDKSKAEADYIYLSNLKKKLLNQLANKLNDIHNTDLSLKAWNLVVGNWLTSFLIVSYDRYYMLKNVNEKNNNLITYYTNFDRKNFIPHDTFQARLDFVDKKWNYIFINNLIDYFPDIKVIKKDSQKVFQKLKKEKEYRFRKVLIKNIKKVLFICFHFLTKHLKEGNKSFVFCGSGFNFIKFLKIRFFINGKTYFEPIFEFPKNLFINESLRDWKLENEISDNKFEKILKDLIPKWIPLIFLEGFQNIEVPEILKDLKEPDFIFTSYDHFHNDIFKIWASKFINKGTRLIVASHVGGFLVKYHMHIDYEFEISDYYLVTGDQTKKYTNSIKIGQYWNTLKYGIHNEKGNILLVPTINSKFPRDLASYPLGEQMNFYFNDQFKFFNNLNSNVKEKLRLRLYKYDQGWEQEKYWKNNCREIKLANNNKNYSTEVSNSSLVVCTYIGRAFVELLAANIPTLIFWNQNYWEVNNNSLKDLENLKEVGIFHDNPINASNHLNYIFDQIDDWWFTDKVQKQRIEFCDKYAYYHPKIFRDMGNIINSFH